MVHNCISCNVSTLRKLVSKCSQTCLAEACPPHESYLHQALRADILNSANRESLSSKMYFMQEGLLCTSQQRQIYAMPVSHWTSALLCCSSRGLSDSQLIHSHQHPTPVTLAQASSESDFGCILNLRPIYLAINQWYLEP